MTRPPCFECGQPSHEEHHVIPRSRGGTRTVPLCSPCHGRVHGVRRSDDMVLLSREGQARAKARGVKLGRKTPSAQTIATMHELHAEGWTLRQIAKYTGLTPATIRKYGPPSPTPRGVRRDLAQHPDIRRFVALI